MPATSRTEIPLLRGPVPLMHLLLRCFVRPGDRVVDATCGNGHDTLLLAQLTGSSGQVWGFDIQRSAIDETARKLAAAGLSDQVTLLKTGHESMAAHLAGPLQLVLFNLGYLPGGDRSLITRPETTISALQLSLGLLAPGGFVLLTIYPGHSGGEDERQAVDSWAGALPPGAWHCWRMGQLNVSCDAPYCIIVQKVVR